MRSRFGREGGIGRTRHSARGRRVGRSLGGDRAQSASGGHEALLAGQAADPTRYSHRQRPFLSPILSPAIPASLAPYLPASTSQKTYHASQAYAKAKMSYGSIMSAFDQLENALLLTGVLAPAWSALVDNRGVRGHWTLLKGFWDFSGAVVASVGRTGEIKQSLVFVALMTLVGTVLATPKAYWKAFVLEEAHGFNKMTRSTFWVDQVKGASSTGRAGCDRRARRDRCGGR